MVADAFAETVLSEDGEALLPIVISEDASERTEELAEELAWYLEKISGAAFEIERGDGSAGIALGTAKDLPELGLEAKFDPGDPFRREEYVIRSGEAGLLLVGATERAVSHAVWDLLHRFGYRHFFPTDTWQVIPERESLRIEVDEFQYPDFHGRRFWHGSHRFGTRQMLDRWQERNRAGSGFNLNTGHSYGGIISRNREAFDENPEFLALRDGERGGSKFCVSNEGLRELVVGDAINRTDPDTDSISMDPSDGGGWCECEECEEMGTVTDRVVYLANEVAEAINELDYGNKYVGIYAYGRHSPPPSEGVKLHPRIIVSASTRFIRGGYSFEELMDAWAPRAGMMGIREHYYSSNMLPGAGRAARINYLRDSVPMFHDAGARFNSINISGAWGSQGLGLYLLSRFHWDVSEAERVDELFNDFLDKAFGDAKVPMRDFYEAIHPFEDDDQGPLLSEDLLARMYGAISEARELTDDPGVTERLRDMVLYTRHAELYHQMMNVSGNERQELYKQWIQHSYDMGERYMTQAGRIHGRRASPRGVSRYDGEKIREMRDNPNPYTSEQIDRILEEGVARNERLDFSPLAFSDDLIPAAQRLDLPELEPLSYGHGNRHRGQREFLIWLDEPGEFTIRVRGGDTYQDRGNVEITLFSPEEPEDLDSVDYSDEVPPDQEVHDVTLSSPHSGLHALHMTHHGARFHVEFPDGMPVSLKSGFRPQVGLDLYFYVPKGTEVVGGYVDSGYRGLYDGDGELVFSFEDNVSRGMFSAEVPEGQDGRVWRARTWRRTGVLELMTVPPYLARTPQKLLLPREVVEADGEQ